MSPGHGFKGKQVALATDDNVSDMYIAYNGKKSINMWLKSRTVVRKRQSPATADVSPPPKRANRTEAHIQKMDELQSITEKLKGMANIPIFQKHNFTLGEIPSSLAVTSPTK